MQAYIADALMAHKAQTRRKPLLFYYLIRQQVVLHVEDSVLLVNNGMYTALLGGQTQHIAEVGEFLGRFLHKVGQLA